MTKKANAIREVYFVQAEKLRLIKIGVTNGVARRIVAMQTLSPDKLNVLGVIVSANAENLERSLHAKFAAHRAHGEWFEPHDDILSHIAQNAVPLDSLGEAWSNAMIDLKIARGVERQKNRWLRNNGFAHLVGE